MAQPLVTVVIPTKNSLRTIAQCVNSIRGQSYNRLEIILVDNYSVDGTVASVAGLCDKVIIAGPERSSQRNAGVKAGAGQYVAIIDSDMYLGSSVIEECVEIAQRHNAAVTIPEVSVGVGFWSQCKALERSCYNTDRQTTAARFFNRATFLEIGGYDEKLWAGEDWDFSIRVERKHPIFFASASIEHDEGQISLRKHLAKKFYYGESINAFVKKHGLARLAPLRSSLLANLPRLAMQGHYGMGVLLLKVLEAMALYSGMLVSSIRRARPTYNSR